MKASELRVGNLHIFKMNDKFEEPCEWDEICVIDAQDIVYLSNNPDDPDYEPIPLTEQWLFDFGFQIEQNGWYLEAKKNNLVFDISYILEEITLINSFKRVAIKHVHQLQNLYFALTGQELTLKQK